MYGEHGRRSITNLARNTPIGIQFDIVNSTLLVEFTRDVVSPSNVVDGKRANLSPSTDMASGVGFTSISSAFVSCLNKVGLGAVNRRRK